MMRIWIATAVLTVGVFSVATNATGESMQMGEIIERVQTAAAGKLGEPGAKVDINQSLVAQGMDELDVVEIVRVLEKEFKISLPDEQWIVSDWTMLKSMTVRRLAEIVAEQLQKKR